MTPLEEKAIPENQKKVENPDLVGNEIYAELERKGCHFGEHFRALTAVSFSDTGKKVFR